MEDKHKFWLKDIPYFFDCEGNNIESCKRYYFIHENANIFTSNGNKLPLYRAMKLSVPMYLINPNRKGLEDWCKNFFMVLNIYDHQTMNIENIMMNGKKLNLSENESLYSQLWKITMNNGMFDYDRIRIDMEDGSKSKKFVIDANILKGNNSPYSLDSRIEKQIESIPWFFNSLFDKLHITEGTKQLDIEKESYTPILTNNFPELPWNKDAIPFPKNYHWGQFKLLISEIEFLTIYSNINETNIIVYAGSAPGNHIPLLSRLFPNILFILYDPSDFAINPTENIIIRKQLFTDADASLYEGMGVLFISDIRLGESDPVKFEKLIDENNYMNMKWVTLIKPKKSLLKFRFPYLEGERVKKFFSGTIYLQVFAPEKSGETRFVPDNSLKVKKYDIKKYERQMFYFNMEYRNKGYYLYDEYFGANYDVYKTSKVLKEYLKKSGIITSDDDKKNTRNKILCLLKEVEISLPISKNLTSVSEFIYK